MMYIPTIVFAGLAAMQLVLGNWPMVGFNLLMAALLLVILQRTH